MVSSTLELQTAHIQIRSLWKLHSIKLPSLSSLAAFKMLFKSITLAAFAASVVSQEISAADVVSNINRLTTLTRIATSITHFVVYLNNPVEDRLDTIAIIEAIATQGTLDQNFMTGNACGALTKRYPKSIAGRSILEERQSTAFTAEEQTSVTNAYSTVRCSVMSITPYPILTFSARQCHPVFYG